MRRIGASLTARAEDLAALISTEVGSPLAFSRGTQVGLPIKVVEGMASELDSFSWEERIGPSIVVREPAGIVGAITPWNYPLHQMVAKVAAALAAGCTVVVKPSQVAPLSAFVLADVLVEAGLPPGVCNIVTGHGRVLGEAIVVSPGCRRRVTHRVAGRRPTGDGVGRADRQARHARARRQVGDCRPRRRRRRLDHPGMCCPVLPQRRPELLRAVPSDRAAVVARRVEEIATTTAEAFVVGDPFDPATEMGPLVSATQRTSVRGYIRIGIDEGARMLCGGTESPHGLDRGYFVRPTVFSDVDPAMRIAQEEIFGPVLCLLPHDGDDDAVSIANNSRFGLAGAVWSADKARAEQVARRMRTGRVVVNGGEFNARAPFGGYRQSGIGRELGRYGIEEFLETKTLQC